MPGKCGTGGLVHDRLVVVTGRKTVPGIQVLFRKKIPADRL